MYVDLITRGNKVVSNRPSAQIVNLITYNNKHSAIPQSRV